MITREEILENRRKFVEALRSGEYKQGSGQLYIPEHDCYCALGVACKVAGFDFEPEGIYYIDSNGAESPSYTEIGELFGFSPDDIYTKNDGGFSFEEIAKFIESLA